MALTSANPFQRPSLVMFSKPFWITRYYFLKIRKKFHRMFILLLVRNLENYMRTQQLQQWKATQKFLKFMQIKTQRLQTVSFGIQMYHAMKNHPWELCYKFIWRLFVVVIRCSVICILPMMLFRHQSKI